MSLKEVYEQFHHRPEKIWGEAAKEVQCYKPYDRRLPMRGKMCGYLANYETGLSVEEIADMLQIIETF